MTARVVHTHSTYVDGLMKLLSKISLSTKIKTIIPGLISRTNGSARSGLELRLTTVSQRGSASPPQQMPSSRGSVTQKVIARHLNSAQEVFFVYEAGEFINSDSLADHMRELTKKHKPAATIVVQKEKDESELYKGNKLSKPSKSDVVKKSEFEKQLKARSNFEWTI